MSLPEKINEILIENDSDYSDENEDVHIGNLSPVLNKRSYRKKSAKKNRGPADTSYKKKFLFQVEPKEIDRKSKGLH